MQITFYEKSPKFFGASCKGLRGNDIVPRQTGLAKQGQSQQSHRYGAHHDHSNAVKQFISHARKASLGDAGNKCTMCQKFPNAERTPDRANCRRCKKVIVAS
ncbi:hypothetical protein JQ628_06355 [Bradyrhizobium lablabi]|uniref:hypothetical protein n=1 Tax=Bradyrhizobium lablabi TaxID=722472 RepID=UPI001BA6BBD2|nr:hypothetical protein [Bradyrhizobium lablabi]MBR1121128.1 hypothetical protein [Bradyrhizobium lablabi]